MEKLNEIITKIREIDKALDAYEYSCYTFEEYNECINNNIRGNKSIRNYYKNNKHIWTSFNDSTLKETKNIINKIYKHKIFDDSELESLRKNIINLYEASKIVKKNTDDYTLYPIQSELIGKNLNTVATYLKKYINNNYETNK